jgi:branched-chain amino acid transport system ATP-binding protein
LSQSIIQSNGRAADIRAVQSTRVIPGSHSIQGISLHFWGLVQMTEVMSDSEAQMTGIAVPVVEARNVSVNFGSINALTDVDLAVDPGSFVGLIGPNGAGKSTLFNVLCGLQSPSNGTVLFNGQGLPPGKPQFRARKGMARTFQHPHLFAGISPREQLILADRSRHSRRRLWTDLMSGRSFRKPDLAESDRVDKLLSLFSIEHLAHHDVAGLPMGSCRLIEVARALATCPEVLLLDEPAAGLDHDETEKLSEALKKVAGGRSLGILLVEHDLEMVLTLSELVYVLEFGGIIAKGSPTEIRKDPSVRAAYLGASEETRRDDH